MKNYVKKFLNKTAAIALLNTALVVAPMMYEKKGYAGQHNQNFNEFVKIEIPANYFGYRRLSDNRDERKITKDKKPKYVKKTIQEIVTYAGEKDTLYVPIYQTDGERGVPTSPPNCARYSRFASEDIFGLKYNYDEDVKPVKRGAWNYRHYNEGIVSMEKGFSLDSLEKLVDSRIIQPGMLVGIYNPKSKYRNGKDVKGDKRAYTHIGVFLGEDSEGKMKIAHQWGKKTQVNTIDWFYEKGLVPKEILDVPDENLASK